MALSPPSKRSAGYSLIELLVVLAVVGILAVAFSSYRTDNNGPAVRGALNGIFGALVDARSIARGTGMTVTLTPSGTGDKAVLTYKTSVANGPSGQYSHATDSSVARYCIVDMDGSTTAGSAAISDLKSDLEGAKANNTTTIFGATAWTQSVFDSSKPFWFNNNGSANKDAFVAIVGAVQGNPLADGPIGIILINASGNIFRYYKANSGSAWVRL